MSVNFRARDLLKSFAKQWLPTAILRFFRRSGGGIQIEGNYASWEDAAVRCTGYQAETILSKVLDATLKVKRGEAVFERDSVLFDHVEYSWPVTAALMWTAARDGGRLDVLDFGGSLGSCYFQNLAFLNGLHDVKWSVIEQEHFVKAGRNNIADGRLSFFFTVDDCLEERKPNVVLFSSVLQYLQNADAVLKQVFETKAKIIIIDRTPFHAGQDNRICIQHVPETTYLASYPMKIYSLNRFFEIIEGWKVIAQTQSPEGTFALNDGFSIDFMGFILERKYA